MEVEQKEAERQTWSNFRNKHIHRMHGPIMIDTANITVRQTYDELNSVLKWSSYFMMSSGLVTMHVEGPPVPAVWVT